VISVEEVVLDPDLIAPEPFTVQRTTGEWVTGVFQPLSTATFQLFGPVQQASNREIAMLSEADRVGSIRYFWATVPIYLTRATAPVPGVHGEVPGGVVPGTVYDLTSVPPGGVGSLYVNGLLQTVNLDYTLSGAQINMNVATPVGASLYFTWPITVDVQTAYSDVLTYKGLQYRVLQVYHDFGGGYWKALGTRLTAA